MLKLTQKRLKELLYYNPKTGIFTRKVSVKYNALKNTRAGCINTRGYIQIRLDNKEYRAHRLAFLYMKGYFPENEIDHKNGIRTNNKWKNLREVSHQCNIRNTGNYSSNTSGIKGVYFNKREQKWRAYLKNKGIEIHLGYHKTFDDAVCARLAGEQCLNWSGCDDNSPAYQYVQKMLKR